MRASKSTSAAGGHRLAWGASVLITALSPFAASAEGPTHGTATAKPTPTAAPSSAPVEAPNVDTAEAISVIDPMLVAPPRAAQNLGSLAEALRQVKDRAIDYRVTVLDVERAEGQARVALAAALPSINFNASGTYNILRNNSTQISGVDAKGVPVFTPVQTPIEAYGGASLSISHPLINLRAWYGIGTARRNVDAQRLVTEDQKRQLLANVASTLVSVYTSERVGELNRNGLSAALERLQLTKRKQALGAASSIDVLRADQDASSARAQVVTGDESVRQARESLALLLGTADPVGVSPDLNLDGLEHEAKTACHKSTSPSERADVKALRARVEIAERLHHDVELQFVPTVTLSSQISTTTQDTGAAPNTLWNVQALLNIPLWEGGARYGNLRDTRAQTTQATLRLEGAERGVAVLVRQAERGIVVAEDSRKVAEQNRTLAKQSDELTRALYTEGRGTSLELVTAAASLRQANINLALREFDLVRARILAVLATASCDY